MSASEFENLEAVYPKIIASMPEYFDSHQFILRLAQDYQRLYVQALIEYAKSERPFQIAHGQIAIRLHNFPQLVARIGEHNSEDIFSQVNSAVMWQKLKK
jgi:hypothetical protein